jgi:hypothetical protein
MKRRPDSTTSERELLAWLAEDGRVLALRDLAIWRKHGLLPPLASCGTGAGRTYYWRDPLIRKRARIAFDLLERTCQVDQALWGLWLRGYPVPAAKLRRAWLQCTRLRRPWQPMPALPDMQTQNTAASDDALLVQVTMALGKALPPDRRVATILEHAAARLGRFDNTSGAHLWSLLQMAGLALESSALLTNADDALLSMVQNHLRQAAGLLESSASEPDAWNGWLADRIGPPLALVILAMLRSGQAETLNALAAKLEAPGRRRSPARSPAYQLMVKPSASSATTPRSA